MRGVKTRKNDKFKRTAISVGLLFLTLVLLNSVHNVYEKNRDAKDLLTKMQTETVDLNDRKLFLNNFLQKLATIDGIKFEIRKKLNVAAVGERVAVIVDEQKEVASSTVKTSTWQNLKSLLLSLFK